VFFPQSPRSSCPLVARSLARRQRITSPIACLKIDGGVDFFKRINEPSNWDTSQAMPSWRGKSHSASMTKLRL